MTQAVSPLGHVLEVAGFPIGSETAVAAVSFLSVLNTCIGIAAFESRIVLGLLRRVSSKVDGSASDSESATAAAHWQAADSGCRGRAGSNLKALAADSELKEGGAPGAEARRKRQLRWVLLGLAAAVAAVVAAADVFVLADYVGVLLLLTFVVVNLGFVQHVAATRAEKWVGGGALAASLLVLVVHATT